MTDIAGGGYGVEFRVLGPVEAWDGERSIELGPRMHRAVLALLVMDADRVVSVDHLIDQLWGDEPPATANSTLQVYVSQLRRALEPHRPPRTPPQVLLTRPPGYLLRAGPGAVDAARFEALAAEGRELVAAGRPGVGRDALRQALSLWRGAPYADMAFEPFVQAEAARLQELRASAAEVLLEAELALGGHAAAVPELERLAAAEPLRERRWELLALALYRCGRQAEALRALADARRTLGEELGIDAGAPLRRLENDILQQSPALDWQPLVGERPTVVVPGMAPAAMAGQPVKEHETALVGRAEELARLVAVLDRAWQGEGAVVLLSGDPGIGKTRLAEELAARAAGRGAQVAWGRGLEGEGAPALWPWTQIVRDLAEALDPEAFRTALGAGAADIAQIVPEVKEVVPDLQPVAALDASSARTRLYDALFRFLLRVAAARPLVLVLDDLHWADAPSVQLFAFLARQLRSVPAMVVATYRDGEVDGTAGLAGALAALAREPAVSRMALAGLGPHDIAHLLAQLSAKAPTEELVAAVSGRTEGNPFFIAELARLVEAEGTLGHEVPVRVRDVIRRRLSLLPEECARLLGVASVVGRDFDLEIVARAADQDLDEAIEHIEAARAARLVVEVPGAVGWYRMPHALVRDTLYEELSALRRARLHERVAAALEDQGLAEPSQLAHHYWQAAAVVGGAHAALAWADRAADQALARLAYEQAEELLRRALGLLQRLPASRDRDRRELDLVGRLWVLLATTKGRAAEEVGAAATRAAELGRKLDDAQQLARALFRLASLHAMRGQLEVFSGPARELVALAARSTDPVVGFLAYCMRGYCDLYAGRVADARANFERAETFPEALYDATLTRVLLQHPVVACWSYLAIVLGLIGEEGGARERIRAARAQADLVGHPFTSAFALHYDAWLASILRDTARVREQGERTVAICTEGGFASWAAACGLLVGWAQAVDGEPEAGVATMEAQLARWEATGARRYRHSFLTLLAEGYLLSGRPDDALRAADAGLHACNDTGERFYEAELHRMRGEALAALSPDSPAGAEAAVRHALDLARAQGATLLERRAEASLDVVRRTTIPTP